MVRRGVHEKKKEIRRRLEYGGEGEEREQSIGRRNRSTKKYVTRKRKKRTRDGRERRWRQKGKMKSGKL